jgi:hypothetical protein
MNAAYCGGRGGRGTVLLKYFPPLPQQNPARSPVRSSMLHIQHRWYELPRQLPQLRAGETMIPIVQVLVLDPLIVRYYVRKEMLMDTETK